MAGRKKRERERLEQKQHRQRIVVSLMPAVLLFYEELALKWATVGGPWDLTILFSALFSIAYGLLLFVLTSLSKHPKVNLFFRRFVLFVIGVIYTAYYF